MAVICGLFLLTTLIIPGNCVDMFTSVSGMERMFDMESKTVRILQDYLEKERKRIGALTRMIDTFKEHSKYTWRDVEVEFHNPVNIFHIVHRLTHQWNTIDQYLQSTDTEEALRELQPIAADFPARSEFTGTLNGLLRIQDTYRLETAQVASGKISGYSTAAPLSIEDCYRIALFTYHNADYYHSVMWFNHTLAMLNEATEASQSLPISYSEVLQYLTQSIYLQGNLQRALQLTKTWLKLDPDNPIAKSNLTRYEEEMARYNLTEESLLPPVTNPRPLHPYRQMLHHYEAVCRGDDTILQNSKNELCYVKKHHPMFYIRPLKEEVLNRNPDIILYHDMITDGEIDTFRSLARAKLYRSGVFRRNDSGTEYSQARISKNAWLADWEDTSLARMSRRIREMTNLSLETVEQFQVTNYGIGGQYEPHFDYLRTTDKARFTEFEGNRIATVMCYLSHVEAGGATVFNVINVRVGPVKNSCILWYNLLKNGEGDQKTQHAGCPVHYGTKWVVNKWFHIRGQEFRRPCSLVESE